MSLGTCIVAEGVLRQPLAASSKHVIELEAVKLLHVGTVDPDKYPLSKKQLPLHTLRDFSHFRPRTTMVKPIFQDLLLVNLSETAGFVIDIRLYYVCW